uniref:Putative dnaj heat shock domain-containing proteintpr repeat-containing protein n=1 Tax=Amblyomma triste TaxID=251400 RepID=A0A023G221_AMBTT
MKAAGFSVVSFSVYLLLLTRPGHPAPASDQQCASLSCSISGDGNECGPSCSCVRDSYNASNTREGFCKSDGGNQAPEELPHDQKILLIQRALELRDPQYVEFSSSPADVSTRSLQPAVSFGNEVLGESDELGGDLRSPIVPEDVIERAYGAMGMYGGMGRGGMGGMGMGGMGMYDGMGMYGGMGGMGMGGMGMYGGMGGMRMGGMGMGMGGMGTGPGAMQVGRMIGTMARQIYLRHQMKKAMKKQNMRAQNTQ